LTSPLDKRLIEVAFPLKQASIDSVHEKNVRHGHISTLHIWPARRPLAASRAALIATLLPDPGDKEKRDAILKRLGGTLAKTLKKKKMPNGRIEEIEALETEGGVLHWGREASPDMDWFREEIRKAYGGRAPRVLDPFAGGGAIPLEAMRLGCEVTAVDINPVAWFVLKCTLEYPQKLAGQKRPLPEFALQDVSFLTDYFKARGLKAKDAERRAQQVAGRAQATRHENQELFGLPEVDGEELKANLAWHVRAWGRKVLGEARKELARFYPTYAEYCSLKPYQRIELDTDEPLKLVPVNENGEPQVDLLNAGFDVDYLANPANPRWVAKQTVAYLWARTVHCKACRAEIPLLKTRWLSKKEATRAVLTMRPNDSRSGVIFGVESKPKSLGGNSAQKREYDKKLGSGTMSRSGASCPCCGTIMTMGDVQLEGRAGRLGSVLTSVVVDSPDGKEFRAPTELETQSVFSAGGSVEENFGGIPFGVPNEAISPDRPSPNTRGASGLPRYGFDKWSDIFTDRQLTALPIFLRKTRHVIGSQLPSTYEGDFREAIAAYLMAGFDKLLTNCSTICSWNCNTTSVRHTFGRFALPMVWDFTEINSLSDSAGGYSNCIDWVCEAISFALQAGAASAGVTCHLGSSMEMQGGDIDLVVTDPPYYDAIPYSDLMDFYHVWLRRGLSNLDLGFDSAFSSNLGPKWDKEKFSGELIDQPSRFGFDLEKSRRNYEDGMAAVFKRCHEMLRQDGRMVVVFANKQPDAWATLVSALIRAGFVVDGSWPIQTERASRSNALAAAALASSVWLVCRKRDPMSRAGWDTEVLKEMSTNIQRQLRDFWDAGIRGPDFVWAATGPAMEAFSRYPAVKKASESGQLMSVTEFLGHVRRIVVDFVVGRVLTRGESQGVEDHALDDITTYYLLHRNDFGLGDAPAGSCILYFLSCALTERELVDQYEVLAKSGGPAETDEADDEGDDEGEDPGASGGGGKFKLKAWNARKHRSLGLETTSGRTIPLVDQVHKLMQLWVAGDVVKVNDYLDARGLRRSQVFAQLIQALIEQSRAEGSAEECSILERLQNYLKSVGSTAQAALGLE
jgi:putative DNA methylase